MAPFLKDQLWIESGSVHSTHSSKKYANVGNTNKPKILHQIIFPSWYTQNFVMRTLIREQYPESHFWTGLKVLFFKSTKKKFVGLKNEKQEVKNFMTLYLYKKGLKLNNLK